jgi:TonB-linked SusC/RagA family outer membrane protein
LGAQLLFSPLTNAQDTYAFSGQKEQKQNRKAPVERKPEDEEKQTLFQVLKELNRTRGVYFMFSVEALGDRLVNPVKNEQEDVEKILRKILDNTGLRYKKVNDKTFVILTPKENVRSNYNPEMVQFDSPEKTVAERSAEIVAGKVSDSTGSPLAGVSVTIKGRTRGTQTNSSGIFSIEAEQNDILVFSAVGYLTQEVAVGSQATINITMVLITGQMTEVVVTALGIKKQRRELGYSTTTVDGSRFTQARETNLGNSLTGQVAGVNVAGTATGPSGSSRVVIRGNGSLAGKNQPLYVIDGIPFDNTNKDFSGQWGGADFGDGLSTINPDDIESIQVLKSVAASALYGYRGGNGAILITTKSGQRNKGLGVEINSNTTFSRVIDERDYQYVYGQGTQGVKPTTQDGALGTSTLSWGAKLDGSQAMNFLGENYAYSPAKDNFKNFFETGITNQSSIALTGGNDKGHFRIGLSNLYMGTVIPNSNMKTQGVNFNSTYDVLPKLQLMLTANYVFEKVKNRVSFSDAPGNTLAGPLYLSNSFDIRWLKPEVKEDGSELLPGLDIYFNNPYFVANRYRNTTNRNRLTAGLTLRYQLTDWLSAQGQITRDGYIFDVEQITPSGTGYQPGGSLTQHSTDYHELNINGMLEAHKKFNNFSLRANIGTNSQDNVYKRSGIFGAGPFVVPFFYSSSNIAQKPYTYEYWHSRVNSIYASVDLGYKDFLFLGATARNDWFSTLNINSNDYLYPSVNVSFVFSDLLQLPSWVSFAKLRACYASSSNGTEPYRNLLTYGLQGYTLNGQSLGYVVQANIPNNGLKPIRIAEQEVGLNLSFLNNRISLDVAFYNKKTTDDILPVTISPTSGYTGNIVNIGKIRNRGIELQIFATPYKAKNFSWTTSFNFASNDNKVLALSPDIDEIVTDGAYPRWGNGVSIKNIVGLPFAQIAGYAYKRNASGQIIYGDNGMPLQSDEIVPLGSGVYKTTGGWSNDLRYKNFVFSFLFDFKYGAKIYSGTNLLLYNYGLHEKTLQGRDGGFVGPGVDEDDKANTVSVPAQIYFTEISTGSSHITEEFVYDASFIKLRALSLSYSLPDAMLKKGFIKGLTIGLVARNLATLVKHTPNIDPEANLNATNGQGLELSGYPVQRNLGFNVNVKF